MADQAVTQEDLRTLQLAVAELWSKFDQLLLQVYDNRSDHTNQHQQLEALFHHQAQYVNNRIANLFNGLGAANNQVATVHGQVATICGQMAITHNHFEDQVASILDDMRELAHQIPFEKLQADVRDFGQQLRQHLKAQKASETPQQEDSGRDVGFGIDHVAQLRNIKGRVTCLEGNVTNHIQHQVNATVQDQQRVEGKRIIVITGTRSN